MLKANFNTEYLSNGVGIIFSKFGISPTAWTIFSIIPAVFGFMSLYYNNLILGLILFILSGFLDAVDGAVARVTKTVSDKGGYIDGIVDRYVEILLYLGLLFYGLNISINVIDPNLWAALICILIFGAMFTSFTRAYADHRKLITRDADLKRMGGILERFERLMLIYMGMIAGCFNPGYLVYAVVIVAVLANVTALQRILFAVGYKK